jgi:hypothetical protein
MHPLSAEKEQVGSPRGMRGKALGEAVDSRLPQQGAFTFVAIAKTHWRQTQDVPSPSPGAGALGTWQSW